MGGVLYLMRFSRFFVGGGSFFGFWTLKLFRIGDVDWVDYPSVDNDENSLLLYNFEFDRIIRLTRYYILLSRMSNDSGQFYLIFFSNKH